MPGKPVAYNYGLLWLIYGLLWGILAHYFRLLGVPGEACYDPMAVSGITPHSASLPKQSLRLLRNGSASVQVEKHDLSALQPSTAQSEEQRLCMSGLCNSPMSLALEISDWTPKVWKIMALLALLDSFATLSFVLLQCR